MDEAAAAGGTDDGGAVTNVWPTALPTVAEGSLNRAVGVLQQRDRSAADSQQ